MEKITHEIRMTNWTGLIQNYLSSGLSKRQWCLQNQVNEKQFYYWQRKLREEAYAEQTGTAPIELTTSFVEVYTVSETEEPLCINTSAQICVGGCTIEIADSASDAFLHRLLGALPYV